MQGGGKPLRLNVVYITGISKIQQRSRPLPLPSNESQKTKLVMSRRVDAGSEFDAFDDMGANPRLLSFIVSSTRVQSSFVHSFLTRKLLLGLFVLLSFAHARIDNFLRRPAPRKTPILYDIPR